MITYLINMTIALAGFLLLYYVLLQQETMYRFNRVYLLASIIFSLVIPLLPLKTKWVKAAPASVVPIDNMHVIPPMPVQEKAITVTQPIPQDTDWDSILFYVYVVVALIFAVRYIYNLVTIILLASKNKVVDAGTFRYVLLNKEVTPFSFLKNIFVSSNAFAEGKIPQEILLHEEAHVDKRHSLDIIFIELLLCLLWFHPFIYLYRRVVKLNHELEADHAVLSHTHNVWGYKKIMISSILQSYHIPIASSFNFNITKKRIAMMTKQSNNVVMLFKKTLTLPVIASLLFYCSTTVKKAVAQEPLKIIEVVMKDSALNSETMNQPKSRFSPPEGKGLSQSQLDVFNSIINKYKNGETSMPFRDFKENISKADFDVLKNFFLDMTEAQRDKQRIGFRKNSSPWEKNIPTVKQFESFKNASVYGLWIDDKHVSNTTLNKYKNTDFDHFFISKLYGSAKEGRNYTHQLDMMTKKKYAKYYAETKAAENDYTMYRLVHVVMQDLKK